MRLDANVVGLHERLRRDVFSEIRLRRLEAVACVELRRTFLRHDERVASQRLPSSYEIESLRLDSTKDHTQLAAFLGEVDVGCDGCLLNDVGCLEVGDGQTPVSLLEVIEGQLERGSLDSEPQR